MSQETSTMKKGRIVLAVAMAIYVASFFVSAVGRVYGGRVSPDIVGYECASMTLLSPWTPDALKSFPENPLLFIALVFSGWINLVFLVAIGFLLKKRITSATTMLRTALLLMMPACWIVFYQEHATPGLGYFLWTGGMVVAIFSVSLERERVQQVEQASCV
jgi:hypothetical protein